MKKLLLLTLLLPFIGQSQIQIGLDIDGEAGGDQSGFSVSLSSDGNTLAIGAAYNSGNSSYSGHVRIYNNVSGTWTQIGQDIDGEAASDSSGISISLSNDGSIVAIGAPFNGGNGSNSGHVRVYKNISNTWTQIGQDINGEFAVDISGYSVSISSDGSIVAIGATLNDGNGSNSGHVRIYKNVADTWTKVGLDIDGEAVGDNSGRSVSLSSDGSIVAIGANGNDENGSASGHVRVYENIAGTWTKVGLDIDGEAANDNSGSSVSLSSDGSIVAIGAYRNTGVNGANSGHVRVYKNVSGTWTQVGLDIDGEAADDYSGISVSLSSDGSIVAIGAYGNTGVNGANSGHVRIYKNISGTWTQLGVDIDGEAANDNSGSSVSLSSDGSSVAIGAPYNAGANDSYPGHVRVYDLSLLTLGSDSFVLDNVSISPNPTTDFVTINLTQDLKLKQVNVYNYFGQKIMSTQNTQVSLKNLSTGIYILEVETNKGKAAKKVVKN